MNTSELIKRMAADIGERQIEFLYKMEVTKKHVGTADYAKYQAESSVAKAGYETSKQIAFHTLQLGMFEVMDEVEKVVEAMLEKHGSYHTAYAMIMDSRF